MCSSAGSRLGQFAGFRGRIRVGADTKAEDIANAVRSQFVTHHTRVAGVRILVELDHDYPAQGLCESLESLFSTGSAAFIDWCTYQGIPGDDLDPEESTLVLATTALTEAVAGSELADLVGRLVRVTAREGYLYAVDGLLYPSAELQQESYVEGHLGWYLPDVVDSGSEGDIGKVLDLMHDRYGLGCELHTRCPDLYRQSERGLFRHESLGGRDWDSTLHSVPDIQSLN